MEAGKDVGADLVVIDVGPNLGALNRAALVAAEDVVIPLAPDLYALPGLHNLGLPCTAGGRDGKNGQRFRIEDHGGNPLNLSVYGRPDHIVPHRSISRRCRARFRHGYGICSRSGIRAIRLPGCGTSGCGAKG